MRTLPDERGVCLGSVGWVGAVWRVGDVQCEERLAWRGLKVS